MHPFIETICIEAGRACSLDRHNARMNRTRAVFYPDAPPLDLAHLLHTLPSLPMQRHKWRVPYGLDFGLHELTPYAVNPPRTLRLVACDEVDYTHKRADRSALAAVLVHAQGADDVLIVKQGLLTDTSIANIALCIDGNWFTPERPLLPGTTRERLLEEGLLQTAPLTPDSLCLCTRIRLFNALVHWGEVELLPSVVLE